MNYDENKKIRYGGTYACLRHGAALCNNAHTFSWRDAFTHAYSCFANGILMWTSFRIADWFYHAFTSLCSFWYASILSQCHEHGFRACDIWFCLRLYLSSLENTKSQKGLFNASCQHVIRENNLGYYKSCHAWYDEDAFFLANLYCRWVY